jgi:polyhydroxybutyrate depolymerase
MLGSNSLSVTSGGIAVKRAAWSVRFVSLIAATACTAKDDPLPTPTDAACADTTPLVSGTYTFDDQGATRTYRVFAPDAAAGDAPAPLIFAFHGWGGDEDEFLDAAVVATEAAARGYVVVAPLGLGPGEPDRSYASWSFRGSSTGVDPSGAPICDEAETPDYRYPSCTTGDPPTAQSTCAWTHCQADDGAFVDALLADLQTRTCIDPDRIYATGGSNGGMFVWDLGQRDAGRRVFAAIAPLIGLPHAGYLDANAELPVLLLTGTRDRTVPPGEWEDATPTVTTDGDAYFYTGATAITRAWADARGCDTAVPAAPYDDGVAEADCRTYCSADSGWPGVLDCRADMGHTYSLTWAWPLILDFFDAHPRRAP